MDITTKQRLLTICSELEAKNLPISVGLLKAKIKQPVPLPKIIGVINAFKAGERAHATDEIQEKADPQPIKEIPEILSIDDLAQQIAIQQNAIDTLQAQVLRLTQTLEKMGQ